MSFPADKLSRDSFLGGALSIAQPLEGYRAGVDPVLLAASVPASSGQSVLELGCGVGTAILCLGHRIAGLELAAVELQSDYAELARQNAVSNQIELDVYEADLQHLPAPLKARNFDHVIANPPYYSREEGTAASNLGRDTALAGGTALAAWVEVATRRLKPKGYLSMIMDMRRLPELLGEVHKNLGSIEVLPLASRDGRAPKLALLRARKGGRASFILHAPLVMHEGSKHERDGDSYRTEISAILRDGAALNFPQS